MRLADRIKLELMKYYRFKRGFEVCCTEGIFHADFNALDNDKLIEVEIKISKSDFKHEFVEDMSKKNFSMTKFKKHQYYAGVKTLNKWCYSMPNYFYFCVPEEMVQFAAAEIMKHNKKYGLIAYNPNPKPYEELIRVALTAQKLTTEPPNESTKRAIIKRVTSEMINAKESAYCFLEDLEIATEKLKIIESEK